MSIALARKYRPSTFDDLIGQESVSGTLSLALDGDRLSHAYLFSGLRGSGKTSTARIFAKALLCEEGQSSHVCNKCSHCIMANENRHMDIIEMDAASNRGIDDIKDLIEHTKYKPSSARYKIFIIDEVHMLTPQAFNALLKTLEEPPPFIKFILATTDPLKLPTTILSRTQHFRFKKIPLKLILQHLEHILNKEQVEYEKEALEIIARSGAGSLRDSLTLLDQAIVYSKNYVDIVTVTNMLGIIEPNLLENLIDNIMQKDHSEILTFIRLASDYETEMIIDEMILLLKDLLLSGSSKIPPMIIDRFFRILADAKPLLNIGGDEEFILSLTLFKMMEALDIKDIDMMIKSLESELKGVVIPKDTKPSTYQPTHKESIEPVATEPTLLHQETTEEEEEITQTKADSDEIINYANLFKELIKKIYDRDYELGSVFEKNISFAKFESDTLSWESIADSDDKEMLKRYWSIIKMFVQEIFGIDTKIVNIPKEIPQPATSSTSIDSIDEPDLQIDNYDDIEMSNNHIMPPLDDIETTKERESSSILEEPMIEKMIELFDPKRVTVKRKV